MPTSIQTLKIRLHAFCLAYVEQRIATAQNAIAQAQKSANEETKSSAGDKYETGRAMMQIEIEKNSAQLGEAHKLKKALLQISPDRSTLQVQPGALVITNFGNYYLSVGAGQYTLNGKVYITISPMSSLGSKMIQLKVGDRFKLNGREYLVESIA